MTKITSNVIADARLMLENYPALAMPCIVGEDCRENLRPVQLLLTSVENSQFQKIQEHAGKVQRKHMDHIVEKRFYRKLSLWLGT